MPPDRLPARAFVDLDAQAPTAESNDNKSFTDHPAIAKAVAIPRIHYAAEGLHIDVCKRYRILEINMSADKQSPRPWAALSHDTILPNPQAVYAYTHLLQINRRESWNP